MSVINIDSSNKGKLRTQDVLAILLEAERMQMLSGRRYTENVDPNRTHLNWYWRNPLWDKGGPTPDFMGAISTLMERYNPGKHHRKIQANAVVVRSLVVQTTPDYFFPKLKGLDLEDQYLTPFEMRGPIDQQALEAWKNAVIKHMHDKWGDRILSMQLHLDESSPHLHVQLVPITDDGRLSSRDLFNRQNLKKGQTDIARAVAKLGIVRARDRDNGEKPIHNYDYKQWPRFIEEKRKKALNAMFPTTDNTGFPEELKVPPPPPKPIEPEKPGIFASTTEKADYEMAMVGYEIELADYQEKSNPQWRKAEQKRLVMNYVKSKDTEISTKNTEIKSLKQANSDLAKELSMTKQQLQRIESAKLRSIPLPEVIARCYPDYIVQDSHDKSIWRSTDGSRKIGITNDLFIDNKDGTFKGKGAIDFICAVDNCTPKQAIGKLRDYFGSSETLIHLAVSESDFKKQSEILANCPATIEPAAPAANADKIGSVKSWCKNDLKISPDLTNHLINTNQIYADDYSNCIVPRPNGGCFKRGTCKLKNGAKNRFKQTTGSKKAGAAKLTGPESKPDGPAILCEGISDALTLLDDYPDSTIYIVGGNLHPDLPNLSQNEIWLAFDRDQIGREHFEFYNNQFSNVIDLSNEIPNQFKDWAEFHYNRKQQQSTSTGPNVSFNGF